MKIKRRRGKPCIVVDCEKDVFVTEKESNSLKRVIADYIDDKGTVDLAEIAEQLQIPPKLAMDICDELSNEGKIM